MPTYAYDTGHARVSEKAIMDWYVHNKDKQSIAYFEGGTFSLFFARKYERPDVMGLISIIDALADEGRVVLVHRKIEEGHWEYIAQRVPAYRMKDNQRRKRWSCNIPELGRCGRN